MVIRFSGRSTDYIAPSFITGCLANCSYCYMKRYMDDNLKHNKNTNAILSAILQHRNFMAVMDNQVSKPNQTDPVYYTYDVSCNEDFIMHSHIHDWEKIFQFAVDHDLKFSLATKFVKNKLLKFNAQQKVRIRFSLMPQYMSSILEPNTSKILDRIKAVDRFIQAGYEVHLNFSPVVLYKNWIEDYLELFKLCDKHIKLKSSVKCEVIFLTHGKDMHDKNLSKELDGERFLWVPKLQVPKTTSFGYSRVRYRNKQKYIKQFIKLHQEIIPWCKIRYIF
jgi:spore photoproduct lyase